MLVVASALAEKQGGPAAAASASSRAVGRRRWSWWVLLPAAKREEAPRARGVEGAARGRLGGSSRQRAIAPRRAQVGLARSLRRGPQEIVRRPDGLPHVPRLLTAVGRDIDGGT
jgi:hypothetical protein